jgi:hypothetical protein
MSLHRKCRERGFHQQDRKTLAHRWPEPSGTEPNQCAEHPFSSQILNQSPNTTRGSREKYSQQRWATSSGGVVASSAPPRSKLNNHSLTNCPKLLGQFTNRAQPQSFKSHRTTEQYRKRDRDENSCRFTFKKIRSIREVDGGVPSCHFHP